MDLHRRRRDHGALDEALGLQLLEPLGDIATGGGVGWLVRKYGLTVDRVRAVEVVLADGTIVRADAENEPDLLWVMRGAGVGAGVAVAFEIEAMELRDVGHAQLVLAVDPAGETLRRWADVMAGAPRELSTEVRLASQPDGSTAAVVTAVVASDSPPVVREALEPLLRVGEVLGQQARIVPYPDLVSPLHLHENTGQMPARATNGLLAGMSAGAARALVKASGGRDPVLVQMRSLGGATHDPDPSATAFAHRHQNVLVIGAGFPPDAASALRGGWAPLAPYIDGAYVNFESAPDGTTFARFYPGATGARVAGLWSRFDPEGVLRPGQRP
ncbi:FAD-binding protein [Streptomyces sp. NPDC002309]